MHGKVVISIDAMGGAFAPHSVVKAAFIACTRYQNIFLLICGNKSILTPLLEASGLCKTFYDIIDAKDVILDDHKPVYALRNGKNSSMRKAVDAVHEGVAKAVVSCGNTAALMVMSKMVLGSLNNVKRPAIAGIFPGTKGKSVLLDMGANLECNENVLFQFALMGTCFAKILLKTENPRVAILNIGVEQNKGRDIEQKAFEILDNSNLNFIGYVEANDITQNKADVIVTDGFSGNIALKASEGVAKMFLHILKAACNENICTRIASFFLRNTLKKRMKIMHPNENNGAMLIGLNGIVVKSHGSAEPEGIAHAIGVAMELAMQDINTNIALELQSFEEKGTALNFVERLKHKSAKLFGISIND